MIVCDYNTADSTAKFMTNTGLMDVTWGAYATYPDLMLLPHPLTNGLADNFMSYDSGVRYSSVGDAQPLALVEGWYHPMFAIGDRRRQLQLLGCSLSAPTTVPDLAAPSRP